MKFDYTTTAIVNLLINQAKNGKNFQKNIRNQELMELYDELGFYHLDVDIYGPITIIYYSNDNHVF
ncbi:hypothetical protein BLOT_005282 [Blomia tropicalis]|nr:hypothetical protein BLOT_005282 [Blomia tropicalis]